GVCLPVPPPDKIQFMGFLFSKNRVSYSLPFWSATLPNDLVSTIAMVSPATTYSLPTMSAPVFVFGVHPSSRVSGKSKNSFLMMMVVWPIYYNNRAKYVTPLHCISLARFLLYICCAVEKWYLASFIG